VNRLASIWRQVRFAAVLVATATAWACRCPPPEEEIFLVRSPDADTQALIDRCVDPALHDCIPLCAKVSGSSPGLIVHCEIHPQTDPAFIQVHVGFEAPCPGGD
jgi:hypothetical protein